MKKRAVAALLTLALLTGGCGVQKDGGSGENGTAAAAGGGESSAAAEETAAADMFTDRDYEIGYDESSSVRIQLNGDSIACDSDDVQITDTTAVISGEGTYILSGTLDDGMIVVNAGEQDKVQLVLDGASICSGTSAALYILEADKVFLTLADGTDNELSNGGSFVAVDENNIDGAVFSKQDLTLNGEGSLTVVSQAGHGIVCKDDLVFTSGTYTIEAGSHGLDANDSVRVANAEISIQAGEDGIHAEDSDEEQTGFFYMASGTLEIEAGDDGIHAADTLTVADGAIRITESYEGLEALHLEIAGGEISLVAEDDGLNAAGGTDASGFGGIGGMTDFGGRGGMPRGEMSEDGQMLQQGEMPEDGQMPQQGEMPQDGQMPQRGEMPEDGQMPQQGEMPQDGQMPQQGEMPEGAQMPQGASSDGSILISGGTLDIIASGDGIDANGTLEITGGFITVAGPTQGDTATLDYDVSGTITGGTFIGTGSAGMAQSFRSSEQGVVFVKTEEQAAGTQITLTDAQGAELFSVEPELPFGVVILSSPELVSGETYTLSVGAVSWEVTAD